MITPPPVMSIFVIGSDGATKERWVVEMSKHRELNGLQVPTEASITWKLDRDFTWYELRIE